MTTSPVAPRRFGLHDLEAVRGTLADVYAEVYADRLDDPFLSMDAFLNRFEGHTFRPGREAVVGYDAGEPVGYAYAALLPEATRWWQGLKDQDSALDTSESGTRTLALFEPMVRAPWPKSGAARRIHEELWNGRPEERVTLMVEPRKPGVRRLYERWGYERVGDVRLFPDARPATSCCAD